MWSKNSNNEGYRFGVCSGTLIDDTTFVTAAHCIPDGLETGSNCSDRILLQFPAIWGKEIETENLYCESVLKVLSRKDGYDIAILKVERSKYDRAPVNPNQMLLSSKVHAYTMTPGGGHDQFSGYIQKKTCDISKRNILMGDIKNNTSNAFIFGTFCNVIEGNSGSGLFNEQGELIGVVHSKLDKTKIDKIFDKAKVKYKMSDFMGMFVNIGCASDFLPNHITAAESCQSSSLKNVEDLHKFIQQEKINAGYGDLADSDIDAYIGEGFSLQMERKPRMSTPYDRILKSTLNELEAELAKIYDQKSEVKVSKKLLWATVKQPMYINEVTERRLIP